MDTPPPVPAPAAPQQQVLIPPPKPSGCGCFAGGCMSVLFIIGLAMVVLFGCVWFFGFKMLGKFTATEPTEITMTAPTNAQYSAADAKFDQLKNALRTHQATSVSFSADDLNALVARSPNLTKQKGRLRFEIADSKMTLIMSIPLQKSHLPGFRNRWFNGSARFALSFENDTLNFDPDWIEANGHRITSDIMRSASSGLGPAIKSSVEESVIEESDENTWRNIRSFTLQGDQLVMTTFGPPGT